MPFSGTLLICTQALHFSSHVLRPDWRKEPRKTADKAASNHGISATKFQLIKVGVHKVCVCMCVCVYVFVHRYVHVCMVLCLPRHQRHGAPAHQMGVAGRCVWRSGWGAAVLW